MEEEPLEPPVKNPKKKGGARLKTRVGQTQMVLYALSVIAALFVCIPMGVVLRAFQGNCVLYGQLVWDNTMIYPWRETACDYLIYVHIALSGAYAAAMTGFTAFVMKKQTRKGGPAMQKIMEYRSTFVIVGINPVFTVINIIIFLTMLSLAGVLTGGFGNFCENLLGALKRHKSTVTSCQASQHELDWRKIRIIGGDDQGVDGSNFFNMLMVAVIASWVLAVIWFLQVALNCGDVCRGFSCRKAEEKYKHKQSTRIALRRSRMATPMHSGPHTPRGVGGGTPGDMTPPQGPGMIQMGRYPAGGPVQPAQVHLEPLPPKGDSRL